MSRTTFHPFDGGKPISAYSRDAFPFNALAESLAESAMPLGWVRDERAPFDREFQAEVDRYGLVEMFDRDENSIEVVTFDGEPIGVLDNASIGRGDLDRFETIEQMERREGAEDAARELHAEARRELAREGL